MNLRSFFTAHHWWGKFLGATLGYLVFGSVGSLFGLLIGNLFDRGLTEHLTKPHWHYHAEKRRAVQQNFFKATFAIMGHILKADGRITEDHIQMVSQLMREMRLTPSQRALAQHCFREGKKEDFDCRETISMLRECTQGNPELLRLFIDLQFRASLVGGSSPKKQHALNDILSTMGFAPLNQQYEFYEDVINARTESQSYSRASSHYTSQPEPAYRVLNIPATATKQEVKRAYQRLMSRNHPDKLIAKGAPESLIKVANEKTQQIRKAYEEICNQKGW